MVQGAAVGLLPPAHQRVAGGDEHQGQGAPGLQGRGVRVRRQIGLGLRLGLGRARPGRGSLVCMARKKKSADQAQPQEREGHPRLWLLLEHAYPLSSINTTKYY